MLTAKPIQQSVLNISQRVEYLLMNEPHIIL